MTDEKFDVFLVWTRQKSAQISQISQISIQLALRAAASVVTQATCTTSIECACLRFSRRTQPSPYQATTPPIRPVPFTSAANRRDPRRAAFCVTPATRWSTRAVSDLVRSSVSIELIYYSAFCADPRTTTQLACPPSVIVSVRASARRVLQVQCCSDPESPRSVPVGVPSVRRAVSTTARPFVPFPLYLASRTLVGDEHPLVWRVVHRQSRPGRGGIDTGGVHGEATVTRYMSASSIRRPPHAIMAFLAESVVSLACLKTSTKC
ncbi:unnamed protein product [Trichogramma brassicae]|uniref:Uncharacterized protein n=1 Tax=Trichogramma brassicae TaxID=86971 RepID=A0A6H5J9A9_9HYME|nr:unnamed protein product [Trichogramma brassicae]